MILFNKSIAEQIKLINPTKIAVAYIGLDWKNYINPKNIEYIILSPTIGSNPYAIDQLINSIGWSKIYFNTSLHAKIYRAKNAAIIGSANLTKNGLSGEILFECCTKINNEKHLDDIDEILLYIRNISENDESKNKRTLETLRADFDKIQFPKNHKNPAPDFLPKENTKFHVCWYGSGTSEHSEKATNELIEINYTDELHFHPNDDINVGDYIIYWKTTKNNTPYKNIKPSWMRIDKLIPDGVIDADPKTSYTTLAIQIDSINSKMPIIDREKFKLLISTDKYKNLLDIQDGPWHTNPSLSKEFLKDLNLIK